MNINLFPCEENILLQQAQFKRIRLEITSCYLYLDS